MCVICTGRYPGRFVYKFLLGCPQSSLPIGRNSSGSTRLRIARGLKHGSGVSHPDTSLTLTGLVNSSFGQHPGSHRAFCACPCHPSVRCPLTPGPTWAHAHAPSPCAHAGPRSSAQGAEEWQGHSCNADSKSSRSGAPGRRPWQVERCARPGAGIHSR